jgi:hypothetical protein
MRKRISMPFYKVHWLEALEQRVAEMEQQMLKQESDIKQPKSAKSKQK